MDAAASKESAVVQATSPSVVVDATTNQSVSAAPAPNTADLDFLDVSDEEKLFSGPVSQESSDDCLLSPNALATAQNIRL